MALLLTSVFGVTGCGSDEITQLEARVDALEEQAGSRVKNAAPEASGASDAPIYTYCDLLDRLDLNLRNDVRNDLDLQNDLDLLDLRHDLRNFFHQCDDASDIGADSVKNKTEAPAPRPEPEGDDVDGG